MEQSKIIDTLETYHRALMTAEWLSDDDGPVPLAIVGEADEISYREGGENVTQDSPAVRVYIAGR